MYIKKYRTLINFALFQIGWFGCVLGAAHQVPLVGSGMAFLIVVIHLWTVEEVNKELPFFLLVGIIGSVWESFLVVNGWIQYPSGMFSAHIAPTWIIAMWFLFATTLNVSLRWLRKSVLISMICGALAAPVAYYAGYRMGAVLFPDILRALVLQGIGWSILLPLFTKIAIGIEGIQPVTSKEVLKKSNH